MNTLRLNVINLHAPYRYGRNMDGQMNFVAIISRLTCPSLPQTIEEFSETISLLFDIEEI